MTFHIWLTMVGQDRHLPLLLGNPVNGKVHFRIYSVGGPITMRMSKVERGEQNDIFRI